MSCSAFVQGTGDDAGGMDLNEGRCLVQGQDSDHGRSACTRSLSQTLCTVFGETSVTLRLGSLLAPIHRISRGVKFCHLNVQPPSTVSCILSTGTTNLACKCDRSLSAPCPYYLCGIESLLLCSCVSLDSVSTAWLGVGGRWRCSGPFRQAVMPRAPREFDLPRGPPHTTHHTVYPALII